MPSINSLDSSAAFKWIDEKRFGVFAVHLSPAGVVNHCVAIDCNKCLIFDSEERRPIDISVASLRLCGGNEVT